MSELLKFDRNADEAQKAALALAMLDAEFSNIEMLPDFLQLPVGKFLADSVASATVELDKESNEPTLRIVFSLHSPIELAQYPNVEPSALPEEVLKELPEGGLVSYSFKGALGIQQFRKAFEPLCQSNAINPSPRQLIEMLAHGQFSAIAFQNSRRNDREKTTVDAAGNTVPVSYNTLVAVYAV